MYCFVCMTFSMRRCYIKLFDYYLGTSYILYFIRKFYDTYIFIYFILYFITLLNIRDIVIKKLILGEKNIILTIPIGGTYYVLHPFIIRLRYNLYLLNLFKYINFKFRKNV